MSAETEPEVEDKKKLLAPLRREALLPNERGRGLGTVAVVCTMAGVASGLALATTLMAMQVADSMSVRNCPYRVVAQDVQAVDLRVDHGFLGIGYTFHDGFVDIDKILPGTPAEGVDLRKGDHILLIDGQPLHSKEEVQEHIYGAHAGSSPTIVFERGGIQATIRPTLIAWPIASY